jgi:chorismate-pyruvate lyase
VDFPRELRKLLQTSEVVAALLEVAGSHFSVATIESYERLNNRRRLDRWRSMFCDAGPSSMYLLRPLVWCADPLHSCLTMEGAYTD